MTRLTMRSVPRRRRRTRTGQVPTSRGRDRHDIEYLPALPRVVPNGKVLVHDGLRYWLQNPSGGLEPCDCDWGPRYGGAFPGLPPEGLTPGLNFSPN
jgi:hypothetical protein